MAPPRIAGRTAREAISQLSAALGELGIRVRKDTKDTVVLDVDGRTTSPWQVWPVGTITPAQALTMAAEKREGRLPQRVVVANRSHKAAIDQLRSVGVAYLGLDTGQVILSADGIRIDTTVRPLRRAVGPHEIGPAITPRGRAGIVLAYELCDHPDRPLSPKGDEARLGISSSTISLNVRTFAEHGLVDKHNLPYLPELFDELAGAWRPQRTWLASLPDPEATTVALPAEMTAGGPHAAAMWGAPLLASESTDLYVPSESDQRLIVRQCGQAQEGATPYTVAVAPAWQTCYPPTDGPRIGPFPAAPLLTVALDLASDPARGREALDQWTPDPEVHARVW